MEFMDGICKTRECAWDVLLSESMKDQEATVEGLSLIHISEPTRPVQYTASVIWVTWHL